MSHRRPYLGPEYHNPKKGVCRWCAETILDRKTGQPSTRRTWHTDCVNAYMLATDSGRMRRAVWHRDLGLCASCGQDTIMLARKARDTKALLNRLWEMENWQTVSTGDQTVDYYARQAKKTQDVKAAIKMRGLDKANPANPWQADHIVPLCEANGDRKYFTLENMQTLCHACHAAKTKADTARLRAAKKPKTNTIQRDLPI